MTSEVMCTLLNGDKVSSAMLTIIHNNLDSIMNINPLALLDLVEKCKDASYKLSVTPFGDSRAILQSFRLIDDSESVLEDIRKVALNSIRIRQSSIVLVNPLIDRGTEMKIFQMTR